MPHDNQNPSAMASLQPITTFQMPSAEDLGFYTKKRLNLYDASIEGAQGKASRVSIAAHTNSDLVDMHTLSTTGYVSGQETAPMNSLRLTSVLAQPSEMTSDDSYITPVVSNLKDPLEYIYSDQLGELAEADLDYFRKPIADLDNDTLPSYHPDQTLTTSTFIPLDNCAASVLTVKKMIAVAMEGGGSLQDGAYYSQSVRELVEGTARQALIFKGAFESLDLSGIRETLQSGAPVDSVNGHVYIVTKHHEDPLKGLRTLATPLNGTNFEQYNGTQIKAVLDANYSNGDQLSPFFVGFRAADAETRVSHSVYNSSLTPEQVAARYELFTDAAGATPGLQPSEVIGVAVNQTTANTSGDSASYVLGNEFANFALHKGDLVIIQQSDAGGEHEEPATIKFSFIQRNLPDDQVASTQFVTDSVALAREYLKLKIKDTGTNLLYLTGLMGVPDSEDTSSDDIQRRTLAYSQQLDHDEQGIKDLLEGIHTDVYDRYGQKITKARFLYTLTGFGQENDYAGQSLDVQGVDANTVNLQPEIAGPALWDALVGRQKNKLAAAGVPDGDANSIEPHKQEQYHNLALTCAYLQHQVNVLGRQLYLLTDNDEGFPETISGRSAILENFRSGVTGPGANPLETEERGQDLDNLEVDPGTGVLAES